MPKAGQWLWTDGVQLFSSCVLIPLNGTRHGSHASCALAGTRSLPSLYGPAEREALPLRCCILEIWLPIFGLPPRFLPAAAGGRPSRLAVRAAQCRRVLLRGEAVLPLQHAAVGMAHSDSAGVLRHVSVLQSGSATDCCLHLDTSSPAVFRCRWGAPTAIRTELHKDRVGACHMYAVMCLNAWCALRRWGDPTVASRSTPLATG